MTRSVEHAHLAEIASLANPDGPTWRMVRRHFEIAAFGVNAWTAAEAGATVISAHDEAEAGHEELYLVLSGHATFIVGDETLDAPTGTLVFVRDPGARREAVAREADTSVLAIGAKPGIAFAVSPWEASAPGLALLAQGRHGQAVEALGGALAEHPDDPGVLYNLACAESLAGDAGAASAHLQRSIELDPRFRDFARTDRDFDPIRETSGFSSAISG